MAARKPTPSIRKAEGGPIRPTPRPMAPGAGAAPMLKRAEGGKVCSPGKKRKK